MAKITLDTITSSFGSASLFNTNYSAIETELNDNVLYRVNPEGEANQMENDLDMNSFTILNAIIPEINGNVFNATGATQAMAEGWAFGTTVCYIMLPTINASRATSIDVTGTFKLLDLTTNTTVATGIIDSEIALSSRRSSRVTQLTISGQSGLTSGNPYQLQSESSLSEIIVNFD